MGAGGTSADLLFSIGADPSDAQNNIARFRGLLNKDLDSMKAEFENWSKSVFGSMNSIASVATAGTAALVAGLMAATAAARTAANEYAAYVGEISKGTKATGISAENMSTLREAAEETGTSYEALVMGLQRFARTTVEAASGNEQARQSFARLGVTEDQVRAGQRDLWGLLMRVSDQYAQLGSRAQQTAVSMELFGRGGYELHGVLRQGSAGLEKFAEDVRELGKVITAADQQSLREYKASMKELKDMHEALSIEIGRRTLPLFTAWQVMVVGFFDALRDKPKDMLDFFAKWSINAELATQRVLDMTRRLKGEKGTGELLPVPETEKVKDAAREFYGLTSILESVRGKAAGLAGDEARAAQEIQHLQTELKKATDEYRKLQEEGTITAESAEREAKVLGMLPLEIVRLQTALANEINKKRAEALEAAGEELAQKLEQQQEQTFEHQERAWAVEIQKLRTQLEKRKLLTAENAAAVAEIEAAGLARIGRERSEAYRQELVELQSHLLQMVQSRATSAERLALQYDVDLQRYSEVEEQKKLTLAKSEGEAEAIRQQFALNRSMLLQKYGQEMVALENSQGWQGLFGSQFAQLLAHNEEALREWATSADQAFAMVGLRAVAMEGLGRKAFASFAQGMGQNIASAIIYKKSIGEAMRSALASTLETIAAESLVQAIYATGLGFLRLAQHDYAAASAAFTAAAQFGAIGLTAAMVGRAIAPAQGGMDAAAAGGAGVSGSGGSADALAGANAQPRPTVMVHVYGNVVGTYGVEEFVQLLNDAVDGRDVRLTATQVKQGPRSVR